MQYPNLTALLSCACLMTACGDAAEPVESDSTAAAATDAADGSDDGASNVPLVDQEPVMLVDNTQWEPVAAADDPFYPAGATPEVCSDEALFVDEQPDGPWFEVRTHKCGYFTGNQETRVDVPAGAWMTLRIWHFEIKKGPGPFRLRVALGEPPTTIWETELTPPPDEPLASQLLYAQWPAQASWPKGTPIYWHLTNHGSNSWNFIELSVGGPEVVFGGGGD